MRKFFLLILLIGISSLGIFLGKNFVGGREIAVETALSVEETPTPTPTPILFTNPTRIIIPTIGVDAYIEHVGLDEKRNMDVPKDAANVAWYELGYRVGDRGNAVLAGHFDDPQGNPAVFYALAGLSPGEKIIVTDERGKEIEFEIVEVENFPSSDFPIDRVFGSSEERFLNLITCDGTFDPVTQNYSERTVAFAKAVE